MFYSVVFFITFLLRNSLQQVLPCTSFVDAAVMQQATNILQARVPDNYRLHDVLPIFANGLNPYRWIGVYHHTNNQSDLTCGAIERAKSAFGRRCAEGCTVGLVSIQPKPTYDQYSIEFIVRCECNRPNQRRRRSTNKCCSGWVDVPAKVRVDDDVLPCPSYYRNSTIVANARRIIENHTPPGYTLDSIAPSYNEGANFWRWSCSFIRNDGRYETGCTFLHEKVRLPFRNYCPSDSDVDKTIKVQLTPNKQRYIINYLVNCECNQPDVTAVQSIAKTIVYAIKKTSPPTCLNYNQFGYVKQKSEC